MQVSSSRAGLVRTYHYAHWSLMQLVGALQQLPTSLGPYELRRRICTARPRFSEGASTSRSAHCAQVLARPATQIAQEAR